MADEGLFPPGDVSALKISKIAPTAPSCGAGNPTGMPTMPEIVGANKAG